MLACTSFARGLLCECMQRRLHGTAATHGTPTLPYVKAEKRGFHDAALAYNMATFSSSSGMDWFQTRKINNNLYLTTEKYYTFSPCNIYLIKTPEKNIIVDCGLGVCNLQEHLKSLGLLKDDVPSSAILTHAHFDHSGGAQHFQEIFIHEDERQALENASQMATLNWLKPSHFIQFPYSGFSPRSYRVPPTLCRQLKHGEKIEISHDDSLEVIHLPGHTPGSIVLYQSKEKALFTGDVVYECGNGRNLFDWLPNSHLRSYMRSARILIEFLQSHPDTTCYPGHGPVIDAQQCITLLSQYVTSRKSCCSKVCVSCIQAAMTGYFYSGCFRCCPC